MDILPELTHGVGDLRGELPGPALQLPQRPRERVRVHHGVRGGRVGGGEEGEVHLREHLVQRLQTRSLGQGPVLHVHRQRLGGIHRLLRGVLEEVHALRVGGVGGKRLLAHPQRHSAGLEDKLRRWMAGSGVSGVSGGAPSSGGVSPSPAGSAGSSPASSAFASSGSGASASGSAGSGAGASSPAPSPPSASV